MDRRVQRGTCAVVDGCKEQKKVELRDIVLLTCFLWNRLLRLMMTALILAQ